MRLWGVWLKIAGVDEARIQKIVVELRNEIEALRPAAAHTSSSAQPMNGGRASPMAQQLAKQELRTKVQQGQQARRGGAAEGGVGGRNYLFLRAALGLHLDAQEAY